MLHHRHKQVEPQRRATGHHLSLHGAAALEGRPAADDEGEVVSPQAGVARGRVSVREARRGEDHAGRYAGLEALLLER